MIHTLKNMSAALIVATATTLALAPEASAQKSGSNDTNVTTVKSSDKLMNSMIARARETLPTFWQARKAKAGSDSKFVLKMRFPTKSGGGEHIWIADIDRANGKVTGRISGIPRDVPNLRNGQKVAINMDQVSDWGFVRNGKLEGYYTLRALLPRLPKKQSDYYRSLLAPMK